MWIKKLTWKRDKLIRDSLANMKLIKFEREAAMIAAQKKNENAAASVIAGELYDNFQQNRQKFLRVAGGFYEGSERQHAEGEDGLFSTGNDREGTFLLIYTGKIEFYAKYFAIADQLQSICKTILQIEFYRIGDSYYSINIAKRIMFEFVLPIHGAIATNIHMTLYEKKIWANAILSAIEEYNEMYSVYVWHKNNGQEVVQVSSMNQLWSYVKETWNIQHSGKDLIIIIVLKNLIFSAQPLSDR